MNAAMDWISTAQSIEALEDVPLERALVRELQRAACVSAQGRRSGISFHVPSFKSYASTEIAGCGKSRWPAVSITGAECRLQCDHCKAKILEPMLPALTPRALWDVVAAQVESGAKGMLLTGGSNLRDEVEYAPYYSTIRRIKDTHPEFRIAAHTALVTRDAAVSMEQAGIDVAMLDIIGAQDTVTQVYHLKRPVSDFEESLAYLTRTSMRVVPHIVAGLHYGKLLGEWNALEMVARQRPAALVLVVVMPFYAPVQRPFAVPHADAVGGFMCDVRRRIPELPLLLGCARPAGLVRSAIDAYAVMAGVSAIAHPAEGVVELALRLGREARVSASCCSMSISSDVVGEGGSAALTPIDLAQWQAQAQSTRAARSLQRIPVVAR